MLQDQIDTPLVDSGISTINIQQFVAVIGLQ